MSVLHFPEDKLDKLHFLFKDTIRRKLLTMLCHQSTNPTVLQRTLDSEGVLYTRVMRGLTELKDFGFIDNNRNKGVVDYFIIEEYRDTISHLLTLRNPADMAKENARLEEEIKKYQQEVNMANQNTNQH